MYHIEDGFKVDNLQNIQNVINSRNMNKQQNSIQTMNNSTRYLREILWQVIFILNTYKFP